MGESETQVPPFQPFGGQTAGLQVRRPVHAPSSPNSTIREVSHPLHSTFKGSEDGLKGLRLRGTEVGCSRGIPQAVVSPTFIVTTLYDPRFGYEAAIPAGPEF